MLGSPLEPAVGAMVGLGADVLSVTGAIVGTVVGAAGEGVAKCLSHPDRPFNIARADKKHGNDARDEWVNE